SESLAQFLWKHAKWTIILALLMLAAILWRNLLRFGPIIEAPAPERRQLIEHLQASARFKWKHAKTHPEISQIQQAILMTAARKQGSQQIELEREIQWLQLKSSLSASDIRAALTAAPPRDPLEFLALTQTLYQLRTNL
ncbi:MAG TPA: hypothetical protein VFM46_10650, partial [Pseudomonadales bacterium]|nr:hypothetical protein [Pseudomonadales bacterium]